MSVAAPSSRSRGPAWLERFREPASLAAIVLAGTLVLAYTGLHGPLCYFRFLTGLPCPGCGLTRSLESLWHGRLLLSIRYHPLGIPFFLFAYGSSPRQRSAGSVPFRTSLNRPDCRCLPFSPRSRSSGSCASRSRGAAVSSSCGNLPGRSILLRQLRTPLQVFVGPHPFDGRSLGFLRQNGDKKTGDLVCNLP